MQQKVPLLPFLCPRGTETAWCCVIEMMHDDYYDRTK